MMMMMMMSSSSSSSSYRCVSASPASGAAAGQSGRRPRTGLLRHQTNGLKASISSSRQSPSTLLGAAAPRSSSSDDRSRLSSPLQIQAAAFLPESVSAVNAVDSHRKKNNFSALARAVVKVAATAALLSAIAWVVLPSGSALAAATKACCKKGAAAASASSFNIAETAKTALSFVLHLDKHLASIVAEHGRATYAILFGVVFCETGLVLTPFLPGDSLLFACGALSALGSLDLATLLVVFLTSAFLGDAANYAAGKFLGAAAVSKGLVKQEFVRKTEKFYAKHGARTVVLARFVPIVRTFAPFVAGIAAMPYSTFSAFNAVGALVWVLSLTLAGAAFGNLPLVKDNFGAVVLGIVAVSLVPLVFEACAKDDDDDEEDEGGEQAGGKGRAGASA